jgi:hypothetical protein
MRIARLLVSGFLALVPAALPSPSSARIAIGVSITIAPPPLPDYDQPPIPGPGYIWVPGYWAYGDDGYYWVPGTWVEPPEVGYLWTPGYWDWSDGVYVFHDGYWGTHVGFYGGIDYGFGYVGVGYLGGFWDHGVFSYNRACNNFGNVHITNVYNKTIIINNTTITKVSFHGGKGGTTAQPTPEERAAERDQHHGPTAIQTRHRDTARSNRALLASVNHGRPAIAATAKPGEFNGRVVAARETQVERGHEAQGAIHTQDAHPGPQQIPHNTKLGAPTNSRRASAPPNAPHPMDAKRQPHPAQLRQSAPPHPTPHSVRAAARPHPPAPHPVAARPRPPAPHPAARPHPAPHPVARAAPKKGKHG